jgi:hypothetical protein
MRRHIFFVCPRTLPILEFVLAVGVNVVVVRDLRQAPF